MAFECITVRREGAIEHVVLNRPAVRNAFNEHAIRELTWWADSAAKDRTLRLAVLSGAGPVFCAGADVTWMSRMVGVHAAGEHRGRDRDGANVPVAGPPADSADRPRARRGTRRRRRAVRRLRHRRGSGRCGVRVHRGEAGHHSGRHLTVRAREDRPVGGAGAVSDGCAVLGCARMRHRPRARRRARCGTGREGGRRMPQNCSRRRPKRSRP